jgi:hypothetical protein
MSYSDNWQPNFIGRRVMLLANVSECRWQCLYAGFGEIERAREFTRAMNCKAGFRADNPRKAKRLQTEYEVKVWAFAQDGDTDREDAMLSRLAEKLAEKERTVALPSLPHRAGNPTVRGRNIA